MKHITSKILEFKSTREPVKVLRIFLGFNEDKIIAENFLNMIRKMKTKLNLWLSRDLALYGKSLIYRVCARDVIKFSDPKLNFILIRHNRYQIYSCLQLFQLNSILRLETSAF